MEMMEYGSFSTEAEDMDLDLTDTDSFIPTVARANQYWRLVKAFGGQQTSHEDINIPCGILMYGPASAGKSVVVEDVLQATDVKYMAQVSGYDLMEGKQVFLEEILTQLIGTEAELKKRCDNGLQFLDHLKELKITADDLTVIVVHNAELLRNEQNDELLHVLLSAQEETDLKICVVLLSKVPPATYFTTGYMKSIPVIHFPQYSKDELNLIVRSEHKELSKKPFFEEYLKASMDIITKTIRDVRVLARLFEMNYKIFLRLPAVQENSLPFRSLWKTVKSHLTMDFTRARPVDPAVKGSSRVPQRAEDRASQNLPIYAKFILVAAYIASQNKISSDKRYFVKARTGRRKPNLITTAAKRSANTSTQFVHSRLIGIVAALIDQRKNDDEKLLITSSFLSIIPTLCNAGLLERSGNPLDECKYRCKAEFELIKRLGEDIDVDVVQYLYASI